MAGIATKNAGLRYKATGFRAIYEKEMAARRAILDKYPQLPWQKKWLSRCEKVAAFLEDLTITSGSEAGTKLRLREFQREFLQKVYHVDSHGKRPVRTAVMSIARKNGKSALAAGLALCHLCGPEAESRGEVYSCANDRFQASKIFNEMIAMVNAHDYLRARCNVVLYHKQIVDIETDSMYAALSREVRTKMGLSPSFVIYDEYGVSPDDELYRAMDSAMGARKEPLLMVISTQAADDAAPLSRLIDYGLKIKYRAVKDPSFHLTLYCAKENDNPWVEKTWRKANPALADFRSLEDVQRLASQAQRMPGQENSFRNLILNQRVRRHTPFIKPAAWKACGGKPIIPDGAKVFAALDLGSTRDMSALVLIHEDANDVFHVVPYFWLPGEVHEQQEQDRAPYEEWIAKEYVTAIGEATDPKIIALKIAELNGRYQIRTLAFDRWRIADLQRELKAIGCSVPLVPHGQGYRDMSPAVDILERLIVQQRIRHGSHPVLAWNAVNAVVTQDPAKNRKLDKSKSGGKIDGIIALAMAFSIAMIKVEPEVDVAALIG